MKKQTNNFFNSVQFIKQNCQQIKSHPSQINKLNAIIEKYLEIELSSKDEQFDVNYESKLEIFAQICNIVKALMNKISNSPNPTISKFLEQKVSILNEIYLSSELQYAFKKEQNLEIASEKLQQILAILFQINFQAFSQNFARTLVINQNAVEYNKILLGQYYQNIQNSKLLTKVFEILSTSLQAIPKNSENLNYISQSLSLFFINILPIENIEFNSVNEVQALKDKELFKKYFQSAFIQTLSLIEELKDLDVSFRLYRKLDSKLMGKMNNPLVLADYFLNKFKQQPDIQIEVLSCLFILVEFLSSIGKTIQQKTKEGKSIYQLKNSKRFFKLVQNALRSSKVPFKTIQTMTRVIISQIIDQQSEFSFWALSFFFNLAKKHRKLLDLIKQFPELTLLQRHYNPKIRSLVNQLKKNLNKAQYLDVQKFAKIDCKKITAKKVEQLCQKLNNQQDAQFKIAGLFEDL